MTDLNLGPLEPPAAAATSENALVLAKPEPVVVVQEQQAAGMMPIPADKQAELRTRAAAFVTELTATDPRSPEFAQKVQALVTMGDQELRASANVSNRMLRRPASQFSANSKDGKVEPTAKVANTLTELRTTVEDLDPAKVNAGGAKGLLARLGGDRLKHYFQKYQSAQTHLDAIVKALASGQDELRKDNADIEVEKANMWSTMEKLSEYTILAQALDSAIDAKVNEWRASGRTQEADTLTTDALFPVRQRQQDLLTQLAVSVQGYMALDLIRKNNLELIRGVDRAQTTTIAALRTAVIVAQALANQKLVLDQVTALNSSTSAMIQGTAQMLRVQGAEINRQAAAATIDMAALQSAFSNVFQALDEVDRFKLAAVDSMSQTVDALETQIGKSKTYLERIRAQETGTQPGQLPPGR